MRLYATIIASIRYGNYSLVGDGSNFAFKIAAKPLQIETWLLLIAIQKLVIALSVADPPTTYHLAAIHASQTDRRQTDDMSYQGSVQRSVKNVLN